MKSTKDFRNSASSAGSDDLIKRAVKLDPIRKNGKDKHTFYGELEDDDDELLLDYKRKESVLDYFDDDEDDQ